MRVRHLAMGLLVALVSVGCAASQLKAQKDNAWSHVPQALPDATEWHHPYLQTMSKLPDPAYAGHNPNPGGYAHPFRGPGFVLHPFGVALDYVLVRPFYMLAGLAPEWFGLTAEDARRYQSHLPELVNSRESRWTYE
jgi:hypothetical protein